MLATVTTANTSWSDSHQKQLLFSLLPDSSASNGKMEVDEAAELTEPKEANKPPTAITPEADIYSTLLVLVFLLDKDMKEQVSQLPNVLCLELN